MTKMLYNVKKNEHVWGCFRTEEIRGDDNETSLKEGRSHRKCQDDNGKQV